MKNLYQLLTESERSKVKYIRCKRGETLFKEHDVCNTLGIVIMGNITISSFSYHGREIVFNSLRESEIFGNNLIFSSDPTYKGDVIAKVESVVVLINKNLLLEILQNNNEFLQEFLKINSDFSKSLNAQIKILSFDKAEERFLYFMFINNNRYKYRSITDLSHLLFLKRETLSRLLTRLLLNKDINIDKKNKLIIVNK